MRILFSLRGAWHLMQAEGLMTTSYFTPKGGLPPQTQLLTDRAAFTESYAVIPKGTMTDIVTSNLPFWDKTRVWVLARPLSGFAETFSHYIMEQPAGNGPRCTKRSVCDRWWFCTHNRRCGTSNGTGQLCLSTPSY